MEGEFSHPPLKSPDRGCSRCQGDSLILHGLSLPPLHGCGMFQAALLPSKTEYASAEERCSFSDIWELIKLEYTLQKHEEPNSCFWRPFQPSPSGNCINRCLQNLFLASGFFAL